MKQDKSLKDREFLMEIINHFPDAIVLLDQEMTIKFCNKSFISLFQLTDENSLNEVLGHSIGCKDFHEGAVDEAMKINCSNCKIKNSVKETFSSKKEQEPDTIVLQTINDENKPLKLIQFQSVYLSFKGEDFALLKISDLTELGEKTLGLVSSI